MTVLSVATATSPQSSATEGNKFAFLPWSSNGLKNGIKKHKIAANGYVYETGDRPTEPRRKSKGVSTRQFGGRC